MTLLADMFELLPRVRKGVSDILPSELGNLSPTDIHVFGILSRTIRFFDGIVALLEKNLPEEALVLGRSMFEDALRLAELEKSGTDRAALILGWIRSSITEKRGLIKDAVRIGFETDPEKLFTQFDEEERQLHAYAKSHGIGKLKKFQSVSAAAVKFGRPNDYWTYTLAHELVHGSDASFLYNRTQSTPNTVTFYGLTTDPLIIAGVGCFTAMSLLQAGMATRSIFARPNLLTLQFLAEEVKKLSIRREDGQVCKT